MEEIKNEEILNSFVKAKKATIKYIYLEVFSKLDNSCRSIHSIVNWLCKIKEIVLDNFFSFQNSCYLSLKTKIFHNNSDETRLSLVALLFL